SGSRTPPMPAPPEIWQLRPICAQDPTVAQVATIVLSPTYAPTLTKQGISTTPLPMNAERRTMAFGTARKPASRKRASLQPRNLESTLSHHGAPPGPPAITCISFRRNDSSTAFFSHWWTCHSPACFSATRRRPESSASSACSTASRTEPPGDESRESRRSHASSMIRARSALILSSEHVVEIEDRYSDIPEVRPRIYRLACCIARGTWS